MNFCWVVPHYNHASEFATFLPRLIESGLPCIVVDDGSKSTDLERLKSAISGHETITLLQHSSNRGKGAAVLSGCRQARKLGYTHVIQIDADGQHNPADVSRFIAKSQASPAAIISGLPIFDESVPIVRKYGRKITTFWVMLETLSLQIKDALCGYRLYPLDTIDKLTEKFRLGDRMDFDTEILVKALWTDVSVVFIDTDVRYLEGGTSHFHYLRDNFRLIRLHTGLLLHSLLYLPASVRRRFR